jgi:hypothetical protein
VSEAEQKRFHRAVARLLYLAKRARPDILTTVAYLATRVTRCTDHVVEKLARLLKYVNDTKERGIVLRIGNKGVHVSVYIDAAYGVHHDKKSRTGSAVVVGKWERFIASRPSSRSSPRAVWRQSWWLYRTWLIKDFI